MSEEDKYQFFKDRVDRMGVFFLALEDTYKRVTIFKNLIDKKFNYNNVDEDSTKHFPEFPDIKGVFRNSDCTKKQYTLYSYDKENVMWVSVGVDHIRFLISEYMSNLLDMWDSYMKSSTDIILSYEGDKNAMQKLKYIKDYIKSRFKFTNKTFCKDAAENLCILLTNSDLKFEEKLNSKINMLPVKVDNQHLVYDLQTWTARQREKEDYFTSYISLSTCIDKDYEFVENFINNLCYIPQVDEKGEYVKVERDITIKVVGNWKYFKTMKVGVKDEDKTKKLQILLKLILGYCITGSTSLQKMFIIVGDGGNGKSGLYDMCRDALGTFASLIPSNSLCGKEKNGDAASPSIMMFQNIRVGIVSEMSDDEVFNQNKIKNITGDAKLTGRPLYGAPVEFVNHAKILIGCNKIPMLRSEMFSMIRRLLILRFNVRFVDDCPEPYFDTTLGVYKMPKDSKMNSKLREPANISAFIKLCCANAKEFLNHENIGKYIDELHDEVGGLKDYKDANDTIKQFIDVECITTQGHLDIVEKKKQRELKNIEDLMKDSIDKEGKKVKASIDQATADKMKANLLKNIEEDKKRKIIIKKKDLYDAYEKSKVHGVKLDLKDFYAAIQKIDGISGTRPDDIRSFEGIDLLIRYENDGIMKC